MYCYKHKKCCPSCNAAAECCDQAVEEHLRSNYYSTTNNCNFEMPEEGASIQYQTDKDNMERPFMVYSDWEHSLLKHTKKERHTDTKLTHAAFIRLCTFDDSRTKFYEFRGDDCTTEMILNSKESAKHCIT